MASAGRTIKLQSNEGDIFDVDIAVLEQSEVLKDFSETADDCPIPLSNINSAILKKVIQWAVHHKDDTPIAEEDENREKNTNDISVWDQNFLHVDSGTLFELVLAANYLNMKSLLDVTCKTVANMIRGQTPEQINRTFNIKTSFTPEEEAKIRKEEEWSPDN